MSAVRHKQRVQRARPIIVQAGLAEEHLENLARELQPAGARVVGTLFDAVCDAGQALVGSPVSAVLMGAPPESIGERDVVEAFRRTDPSVRLIRLFTTRDQEDIEDVMRAGFDEAVSLPATANRLAQAVGGPLTPTPHTHAQSQEAASEPDATDSPRDNPDALPSIIEVVLEQAMHTAKESERHEQGGTRSSPTTPFDDADLARVILQGGSIESVALELIRRKTGIPTIQFRLADPEGEKGPRSGTWIEIQTTDGMLGYLCSSGQQDHGLLEPWSRWFSSWLLLQNEHARLQRMALTDQLTGAGNRHALFRVLDLVIERARKERSAVTVMYFDIDNFKTYNDRFGHVAGDKVLKETVQLLNSVIRRGDHVFRVGGDEFVVVFADPSGPRSARSSPPESIEQIAERFQKQVGTLQLSQIGLDAPGTLSISAGMVTYPWDGDNPEDLLQRADQLALESKRNGKNVITFGPAARNLHGR